MGMCSRDNTWACVPDTPKRAFICTSVVLTTGVYSGNTVRFFF